MYVFGGYPFWAGVFCGTKREPPFVWSPILRHHIDFSQSIVHQLVIWCRKHVQPSTLPPHAPQECPRSHLCTAFMGPSWGFLWELPAIRAQVESVFLTERANGSRTCPVHLGEPQGSPANRELVGKEAARSQVGLCNGYKQVVNVMLCTWSLHGPLKIGP